MEIVCRVQANPFTSPSWLFTSQQGRMRNISKEVDKVVERGDMISVVIITNPQHLHLGHYECRASNILGEDSQKISVLGEAGEQEPVLALSQKRKKLIFVRQQIF